MHNPAFLVEGQMEQAIIQRICPGVPVRLIGCNGKGVSMEVMAKTLRARFLRLERSHPIVVIFDREKRVEERDELLRSLSSKLDSFGYKGRYVLGMPDRTTEMWILSDWDGVRLKKPDLKEYSGSIEGENGKSIIKRLLPDNVIYHETTLGVELFCSARPERIYSANLSFRELLDKLLFPCHWAVSINERFQPNYMAEL